MSPPRAKNTPKFVPQVRVDVEAQLGGSGAEWIKGSITDPPKVEDIDADRAKRLSVSFKKEFPVGRYVEVLIDYSRTRHWIYEGWIRVPKTIQKKKRKEIPAKLAEFTEKLQEVTAQAKEEKAQRDAERGVSSKPPAHVLAKRKKAKRK